ncbi:MAG: prepilin peptidase [Chloracidobacterium sp.]|nr:prepilin peptidase [Chloracidobacterium sp.]
MQTFFLASLEALLGIPEYFGYLFVFVIGASIGSFLNVVIYRVPNELSLLPSSKCPKCGTGIKPWHNVPILGWLMLGGKCPSCKEPIAWRYPAVELLTAMVFLPRYWQIGLTPICRSALSFFATMTSLVFIDAEHIDPAKCDHLSVFVIALIVRIVFPIVLSGNCFRTRYMVRSLNLPVIPAWAVSRRCFGALVGGGSLWLVGVIWKALRGVDAMGLGDVKLLFGIGALLGWRLTLLTIFIGAFTGAVAGVALVIVVRRTVTCKRRSHSGSFLASVRSSRCFLASK